MTAEIIAWVVIAVLGWSAGQGMEEESDETLHNSRAGLSVDHASHGLPLAHGHEPDDVRGLGAVPDPGFADPAGDGSLVVAVKPYLQDADFTLCNGDALEILRELPAESVQMCVTSPPFFGLRDYGTGTWEGGDAGCDHLRTHDNDPRPTTTRLGWSQRRDESGG